MSRILITGVGGMMGSHLLEALISDGHDVLGTYYKPTIDIKEIANLPLEEVDVREWGSVYDILRQFQPDIIFHLAAQSYPIVSWKRPVETISTNVIGTINIFEVVLRLEIKTRIVVACSSAEYGFLREEEVPVREERELKPLHPYGVSKVAQDLLAYQYHKNFGIDTIRTRIFNCTGTRKIGDALSDFVRRTVWLESHPDEFVLLVGNLDTQRAIVDVRDLNRALISLAERGKSGQVYNVSGESAYLMQDVVQAVVTRSRRKHIEIRQDPNLMRPTDEKVIWGDTTRLRNATDWKQRIPLEQTIEDMLNYWRSKASKSPPLETL